MKSLLSRIAFALVLFIGVCASANALSWWQMSQSQRVSTFVQKVQAESDGTYGGPCIVWVRNKLTLASSGATSGYPNNGATDWTFAATDPVFKVKTNQSPEYLQFGDIIQMHYQNLSNSGNGPHTAVVISGPMCTNSGCGVYWRDSNMGGTGLVLTHFMTFNAIYQWAPNRTIYQLK